MLTSVTCVTKVFKSYSQESKKLYTEFEGPKRVLKDVEFICPCLLPGCYRRYQCS